MNLQTLVLSGGSPLAANGVALPLHAPVPLNGRSVFRRVFGLRVQTGDVADGVRFDPPAAHLAAAFEPDTHDIAGTGHAQISNKGAQTLLVELPAPMRITGARFTGVSNAGTIEFYRLDGGELTGEPARSIANGGSISGDFTDLRFAMRLRKTDNGLANIAPGNLADLFVRGFPTAPRLGLAGTDDGPDGAFFFWIVPGEVGKEVDGPSGSKDSGPDLARALQQHIDSLAAPYPENIDLLLVAESDAPCLLRFNSFNIPFSLVRTSFRALLLRPADVIDARAFAARLRDGATPLTQYLRAQLAVQTRAAIARAADSNIAERVVAAIVQDLNAALQTEALYSAARFQGIALTAETLAAAQTASTGSARLRIHRLLLAEAFPAEIAPIGEPAPDEKEVLRAQGAATSLDVTVDLPRNATIRAATLRLEGDLKSAAPAPAETGNGTSASPSWDAPLPGTTGVTADASRAIAVHIVTAAAFAVNAIALALSSITATAELIAEIREDQGGTPAGRVLAAGVATISRLDRPAWVHVPFRSAVVIQAAPHWLVLRATDGVVLWLAAQEAGTTRIGAPAAKGWSDDGGFVSIAPLYQLWTHGPNGSAPAGAGAADLATRLRVTIGGITITPSEGVGRARTVNIAGALQAWLSAQPGPGTIVPAPLRIAALGSGSVTIYPPEIDYDL